MKLNFDQDTGIFYTETVYDERHIPKAAGFSWDGQARHWWTRDFSQASLLADHAGVEAQAVLAGALQKVESSLRQLRAPHGCEYLPYQLEAVRFAVQGEATLFADEMGLGKTVEAVGVMDAIRAQSVLVVCPLSVKTYGNGRSPLGRPSHAPSLLQRLRNGPVLM